MDFNSPSLCAGNESISVGLLTGVSGGIGATNACTRMYRLDFSVEHGMRNVKAYRASSSICPWMDGSRTMQEQLSRSESKRARLNRFISREPIGHAIGLPFSWILLLEQAKEVSRALTRYQQRSSGSIRVRKNITSKASVTGLRQNRKEKNQSITYPLTIRINTYPRHNAG